MNPILEVKLPAIIELCRQYGVAKLEIFGSASSPEFDPARSDFDFIVDFRHTDLDRLTQFVDFAESMELLLERPADFAFESAMTNRFKANIAGQRRVIYEAASDSVAA